MYKVLIISTIILFLFPTSDNRSKAKIKKKIFGSSVKPETKILFNNTYNINYLNNC